MVTPDFPNFSFYLDSTYFSSRYSQRYLLPSTISMSRLSFLQLYVEVVEVAAMHCTVPSLPILPSTTKMPERRKERAQTQCNNRKCE